MTDNEIIKALECCSHRGKKDCDNCPVNYKTAELCFEDVMSDALDLINRQNAEIERLAARFNDYPVKTLIDNNNMMCSKSSEDYDKWFFNVSYQAIKEFADRLKNVYDDFDEQVEEIYYKNLICAIDNLVKEMTEVQENDG